MAGTVWPALTAGQKARASDVESKFDWIEGDIVPMSGGNITTGVYDLGTTTAAWRYIHLSGGIMASGATALAVDTSANIKLRNGVAINEISSDGTLADNSDSAVPTEQAVRTYADTKAGAIGMKNLIINSLSAAEMTTATYVDLYSTNTNGSIWGFALYATGSGSVIISVELDTQTIGAYTLAVGANQVLAVQNAHRGGSSSNIITMSTALYTTTAALDDLQFPFKSSFSIKAKINASSPALTGYIKIATG
jgi:hypothetical protein